MNSCLLRRAAPVLVVLVALGQSALAQNAAWSIWVMKVDGSQARFVTQVENCTTHLCPRWSHDGKRIVFETHSNTAEAKGAYVVNADGTELRRLGNYVRPVWSPDDKQIAAEGFANGRREAYVMNVDGTGLTPIAAGRYPCWSPDGTLLATTVNNDIQVTDLLTGDVRGLLKQPAYQIYGMWWFADSKRLAVVLRPEERKHRYLMYISAEGEDHGSHKRLENEMGGLLSFSPDGKRMAIANHYMIFIADVDGKSEPQKVPGQTGGSIDPDWSSDGEWIVFGSSRDVP